jgi:hypothetical protein
MGVNVARPMVNAWLKCEEGFYRLVLDSVEHATTEYEAVAQKWEVERTGQINESAARAPLATAEIKVEAFAALQTEAFAALQTEAFAASSPAPALLSPLGPLQDLPGTWAGTGFRVSWRPSSAPERTDYFLELTLTKETLRFARIHGAIPNRSLLRPDTKMVGLTYDQQITDNNNAGIHIESGYWITVPQTDNPAEVSTVAHMASTPYGTTVLAGTVATPISAAPSIQKTSISPFVIGNPQQTVQFPEPSLSLPSGLRSENLTGITQAMVDNPNEILTNALLHTTVTNTVMLEVSSSSTAAPVLGGGIAMPFLPAAVGQNAQIALVAATYWIETVTDDAGGPDVQQLQYTQTELLNFAGLSWPHITVATLRKMPPTA